MSYADLTKSRFSCRHYEDRALEPEALNAIIEAGRIAPSACNKHPTRLIVCDTPEKHQKAAAACPRYDRDGKIFGASVVFIALAQRENAWTRKYDQMNSSLIDTSIVVDQMMMQATELGLGTCWVCAFDPAVICEQFELPEDLYPISMLVCGYPADTIADAEAREARCITREDFILQ